MPVFDFVNFGEKKGYHRDNMTVRKSLINLYLTIYNINVIYKERGLRIHIYKLMYFVLLLFFNVYTDIVFFSFRNQRPKAVLLYYT